jgi:hypothetical protein
MRTLLRTLAATAALAAVVLGAGASTALAASDQATPAQTYRYVFHDEWCFDQGATLDCSIADGVVSATYTPGGALGISRIHYSLSTTTFDESGVQVGSSQERSFDRSISSDDGRMSTFTIEQHRVSGDGYDCMYGYKLSIVDYQLVTERYTGPGCN